MLDKIFLLGRNFTRTREATLFLFQEFHVLGLLTPKKRKALYYLHAITMNFLLCFLCPVLFFLSYYFESNKMTISQFLTSAQLVFNTSVLALKCIPLYLMLQRQYQAMDIMDILDDRCQTADEREKIHHCAFVGNRLAIFYIVFYTLYSGMTFATSAIGGQPPYRIFIPLMDWRNSSTEFAIQLLIECVYIQYVCLHQAAYDVYPVIYIYIVRMHTIILVERVRNLGKDLKRSNDEHYEDLIKCIADHQNLLRMVDAISPVISFTIFIQFLMTTIVLGAALINILIFADTSSQIASVCYAVAVAMQTTPCAYQATCLLYDCEELSLAILQCEWFDKDKRFRKMMIFFMMRAQTPISFSAMKLFPIDLTTSLSIGKFSFSLYTLIKQMDFGQNLKD